MSLLCRWLASRASTHLRNVACKVAQLPCQRTSLTDSIWVVCGFVWTSNFAPKTCGGYGTGAPTWMVCTCRNSITVFCAVVDVLMRRPPGANSVRCGTGFAGMVIISGKTISGDPERGTIRMAVSAFIVLGVSSGSALTINISSLLMSALSCADSACRVLNSACFSLMLSGSSSSSSRTSGCWNSLSGASAGSSCREVKGSSGCCCSSTWTCSRSLDGLLVV